MDSAVAVSHRAQRLPYLTRTTIIGLKSAASTAAFFALCSLAQPGLAQPPARTFIHERATTAGPPQAASPAIYTITDLGDLPPAYANWSSVAGIDDRGDVVTTLCCRPTPSLLNMRAMIVKNGVLTNLGALAQYPGSAVNAINAGGYAVGTATRANTNAASPLWRTRAINFSRGQATDLGVPAGYTDSSATGVNRLGDAIGSATVDGSFPVVTVFRRGKAIALGAGNGNGVNAFDVGIGTSPLARATIYSEYGALALGTLGGPNAYSTGIAINDNGWAIGDAGYTIPQFPYQIQRAFLYVDHRMHDLGVPAGLDSRTTSTGATAINDRGEIVGYYFGAAGGPSYAFVFKAGKIYDLTSLIAASSGWILSVASAINTCGDIVGTGIRNGQTRGFLLRRHAANPATAPGVSRCP